MKIGNGEFTVVLGSAATPAEKRAAELLTERIAERSGLTPAASVDRAAFRFVIGTAASNEAVGALAAGRSGIAALTPDGYGIVADPEDATLHVIGRSDSGVVAGVGRLMRAIQYGQGRLEIPALDIRESPQMPNRGMYLWARKYYFDQPDRVDRYIEELALWGCNAICLWFEMGFFDSFDTVGTKPAMVNQHKNILPPQEWLKMYRRFFATARRMGMKTGLLMAPNDAYRTSPAEMRIEPIIGCPNCYLCPSKPGAVDMMLDWQEQVFKALAPIDMVNLFPADPGGCSCPDCTPWPTHGLWKAAKPLAERIHAISPGTEIWVDTWHLNHPTFGGKDWKNLVDNLSGNPPEWFAGFEVGLAPHHPFAGMSAGERALYNQAGQPLMVFPDISMWGNHKGMLVNRQYWEELQAELNDYPPALMRGGWPYTERWNTDIANVVFLSWFSNPRKSVETILDEYASFCFGPEAATGRELLEWLDDSNQDPQRAEKIRAAVTALDAALPAWAKADWRWEEIRRSCARFEQREMK